jgi:hypothetical protein
VLRSYMFRNSTLSLNSRAERVCNLFQKFRSIVIEPWKPKTRACTPSKSSTGRFEPAAISAKDLPDNHSMPTNRAQEGVSEFDAFASHSAGESGFVKMNAASLCKAKRSQTHDLQDSNLPSLTGPPLQ